MPQDFAGELKRWRRTRQVSQLALGLEAEVSSRHIAFLETGRARPSRGMVLRLAEALQAPLGARNQLLVAAGFAPEFVRRPLSDAALAPVRAAMARLLAAHEPYPALVIDRRWSLVDGNAAARRLFPLVFAQSEPNLVRFMIETPPFREMVENWSEVGRDMLARLRLESAEAEPDAELDSLVDGFARLVAETRRSDVNPACVEADPDASPFVNAVFRIGDQRLSMFSTIAHFGAARDLTVAELRIELFFPMDPSSEALLHAAAAQDLSEQ